MNTLNPLAEYNNINLVGTDTEDQDLFNTMLENSDVDVLETLAFLNGYGLDIHFGDDLGNDKDGNTIDGQAVVGGNKIVLDANLLEDPAKLKDVFAHELAHILGASHETNDEEDKKFEELVTKLTNGEDDDLNSVFEQYKQLQEENQPVSVENSADGHGDHDKKDDNGKKGDKVDNVNNVENDTEDTDDSGGGESYAEGLFANLGIIAETIGFDVLAKFDELYDNLENELKGKSIAGGPGTDGRKNRDKYNAGIIQIMTDFFAAIDAKVAEYDSYEDLPPELKEGLDATTKWIQVGFHAGKNNDNADHTHMLENSNKGIEGAAFVIAHGMQGAKGTVMDELFRSGRDVDAGGLEALDGEKLFGLMKEHGGLTGLYSDDGEVQVFKGASAADDAPQNPAGAIDYFKNNEH